MDNQLIDFQQNGDTGDRVPAAIEPILDGEDAIQVVFQRPSEHLRQRTEILRNTAEELKYLADADRTLLLGGGAQIAFDGQKFTLTDTLVLKPYLAPAQSAPASLDIGGVLLQTNTVPVNGVNPLRAYGRFGDDIAGANEYTVEVQPIAGTPTPVLSVGPDGDERHWLIIIGTQHTIQDVFNYLTGAAGGNADLAEFQTRYTITRIAGTDGYPLIPSAIMAAFAPAYFVGALDAEVHYLTPVNVQSFFLTNTNLMAEGDVLCIRYDALVMPSGGGRRQSIDAPPEQAKATIPAASLFLLKNHPEWAANALPIARVFGGNLVFVNGQVFAPNTTGQFQDRQGLVRAYATGKVAVGGVAGGDTARAQMDGAGGADGKQGRVRLFDDGTSPVDLDHDKLQALVGGGNADVLHTHNPVLQRWMCDDSSSSVQNVLTGVSAQVTAFNLQTFFANQVVEVAFELMVHLTPAQDNCVFTWELWLDNTSLVATGNVPDVDAASNPDGTDQPFNENPWVPIPAAGTHTLALKIKVDGTTYSLKASRITLS